MAIFKIAIGELGAKLGYTLRKFGSERALEMIRYANFAKMA